ncbi:hypothetical protein [Metabacillus hrfriensis]|uniref:Uncharacterized protein n=1 Tax=Metabacillus hrfriensis TaxID=3048891 RepID=A0ACD4R6Q5_9BACI|nr:hypothetical protein [Metabacillus sp. CT-WN-B3]WHZ56158.1 hypothetical protein QLQ22_15805 [Metabacillus sp. CT-WN-B3]
MEKAVLLRSGREVEEEIGAVISNISYIGTMTFTNKKAFKLRYLKKNYNP